MILVDANLLLDAEDAHSPLHEDARGWWDGQPSSGERVCLCWQTILAFIRISTNRRVFERPNVSVVTATQRHWQLLREILVDGQASAGLAMDAHLAALAVEHGCLLCSTDADFCRFRGVKWANPLTA